MFDYNPVENPGILFGFLIAFMAWYLIRKHRKYADLFVHPRRTWLRGQISRKWLVTGVVLLLMVLLFPLFESSLAEVTGQSAVTAEYGQHQVTTGISGYVGVNLAHVLVGMITLFLSLFEVLIFRGILLDYFAERRGKLQGALLTSLLFALYHFSDPGAQWPLFILTFSASLVFSVVYFYGGIMHTWAAHGGYDAAVNILSIF